VRSDAEVDAPAVSDHQLVARIADGDRAAFAELYRRQREMLFAYVLRMTADWQLAEEILQDVLVTVWRRAASFEGRSSVRTWLIGIARRHLLNHRRVRSADLVGAEDAESLADPDPGPEDQALASAAHAELAGLLTRLSQRHQEILLLTFMSELTYTETAEVLGVPLGTVRSRLHAAKRRLAALVVEGGEERHHDG